ncbi:MAG: flagellar basal body-associated FliL family protein [Chitinispirillales bacterium]|jgi:flagellar basal body-associated protein FliL|nr:flagellar basal body-associated FliL family protein [Chitinispirillales bacterium]
MADDKKAKKDAAPDTAEGEGEKKGSNLGLVIGIIAGIVVLQTALAYLLIPKPVDEAAIAARREEDSLRVIAEAATRMGAVTSDAPIEALVNIAGTDGERLLKATIILEYEEKNAQLGNELRRRVPRYRDLMMSHLSNLTLMEVTEPGAQDKIRGDLLRMINATLPPQMGEVQDVLFREFIVQ